MHFRGRIGYNLLKFKPGQWIVFLIESIDAFFAEIREIEQKNKEILQKQEEQQKAKEKQDQDEKIRKGFL